MLKYSMMEGKIKRRIWHILGTSSFPISTFFLPIETVIFFILLSLLFFLSIDLLRLKFEKFNNFVFTHFKGVIREKERRSLNGSTYVLFSEFLCFYLFDIEIAVASLLFLAFIDPISGILTEEKKGSFIRGKFPRFSLELILCLIIGISLKEFGLTLELPQIFFGSLCASLFSILPLPIDDNLTIPLSSSLSMAFISKLC